MIAQEKQKMKKFLLPARILKKKKKIEKKKNIRGTKSNIYTVKNKE